MKDLKSTHSDLETKSSDLLVENSGLVFDQTPGTTLPHTLVEDDEEDEDEKPLV